MPFSLNHSLYIIISNKLSVNLPLKKAPYHFHDRVLYNFFAIIQYSLTEVKPLKNVEISTISLRLKLPVLRVTNEVLFSRDNSYINFPLAQNNHNIFK